MSVSERLIVMTQPSTDPSLARTVLIVDDEAFIRLMLSDAFEEAGFSAIEASNAPEAIAILQQATSVDLLISDIRMPGDPNGLGLATWVSEHRPETKVILMSGYYESQHIDRANEHYSFVRKPFKAPQMFAVAERLLARPGR